MVRFSCGCLKRNSVVLKQIEGTDVLSKSTRKILSLLLNAGFDLACHQLWGDNNKRSRYHMTNYIIFSLEFALALIIFPTFSVCARLLRNQRKPYFAHQSNMYCKTARNQQSIGVPNENQGNPTIIQKGL